MYLRLSAELEAKISHRQSVIFFATPKNCLFKEVGSLMSRLSFVIEFSYGNPILAEMQDKSNDTVCGNMST